MATTKVRYLQLHSSSSIPLLDAATLKEHELLATLWEKVTGCDMIEKLTGLAYTSIPNGQVGRSIIHISDSFAGGVNRGTLSSYLPSVVAGRYVVSANSTACRSGESSR